MLYTVLNMESIQFHMSWKTVWSLIYKVLEAKKDFPRQINWNDPALISEVKNQLQ